MPTIKPKKSKLNSYEREQLAYAIGSLAKFLDPNDKSCTVDPKVREAAKLYLKTWVLFRLENLRESAEEGKKPNLRW